MALGVWLTQKDAGVFVTLIPVLAFAIPAATVGIIRLTRAYRALSPADRGNRKAVEQSKTVAIHSAPAAVTDPLVPAVQAPVSVTENTTLNLLSPEASPEKSVEPLLNEARVKLPS